MPASLTRWVTSLKVALNPGSAPVLFLGESEAQGDNRIRFWEVGRGKNRSAGLCYAMTFPPFLCLGGKVVFPAPRAISLVCIRWCAGLSAKSPAPSRRTREGRGTHFFGS